MRRIIRDAAVAVVCGSVALLGACTIGDGGESGSSSPAEASRAAEDLLAMLVTPEDLGGSWEVAEDRGPRVVTDADLAVNESAFGPADYPVCADAPDGAAARMANVPPWTVRTDLTWPRPQESPATAFVFGAEWLVSGAPEELSAVVAVVEACPVEYDEPGFSQTPPAQLPVEVGDEAVVWRTGGTGSRLLTREWMAFVRVGDVLVALSAIDAADEEIAPVLTDEVVVDIVRTAADKLG